MFEIARQFCQTSVQCTCPAHEAYACQRTCEAALHWSGALRRIIKPCTWAPSSFQQASIILIGGYAVQWKDLGRYPFRITKQDFAPGEGDAATGELTSSVSSSYCTMTACPHTHKYAHARPTPSVLLMVAGPC